MDPIEHVKEQNRTGQSWPRPPFSTCEASLYDEDRNLSARVSDACAQQVAFKMMEEDLGRSVRETYASITPQPIAAASLGQVYKATLFTGEEVAVKVQRPNIISGIELDIFLVRVGASVVDKYLDR